LRPPAQASRATRFSASPTATLGRDNAVRDQLLGEGPATGRAAGAAIGARQHLLELVDVRIHEDIKLAVGHGQHGREGAAEPAEEESCHCDADHCRHVRPKPERFAREFPHNP
jgi:hypothetical protein